MFQAVDQPSSTVVLTNDYGESNPSMPPPPPPPLLSQHRIPARHTSLGHFTVLPASTSGVLRSSSRSYSCYFPRSGSKSPLNYGTHSQRSTSGYESLCRYDPDTSAVVCDVSTSEESNILPQTPCLSSEEYDDLGKLEKLCLG